MHTLNIVAQVVGYGVMIAVVAVVTQQIYALGKLIAKHQ